MKERFKGNNGTLKHGVAMLAMLLFIGVLFSVLSISLNVNKYEVHLAKAMAEAAQMQERLESGPMEEEEAEEEVENIVIINTYIGPEISSTKASELLLEEGESRDYALKGDKIKYTITVENAGGVGKDVVVKDTIPDGTTFVQDSIVVTPNVEETSYNETDLTQTGITVNVPASTTAEDEQHTKTNGKVTISFQVTVDELDEEDNFTKTITNIAKVNNGAKEEDTEDPEPIEVREAKISVEKTSETKKNVTIGDEIVYKITVTNEGTAPEKVLVKDTIPEGTSLITDGIKIGEDVQTGKTAEQLAEGIEVEVPAATQQDEMEKVNGEVVIEVKVRVTGNKQEDGKLKDGDTLSNEAIIDENPKDPGKPENEKTTKPVEHTYVEPIISSEKTSKIEKEDSLRDYALEGEIIEYTITVTNKGRLEKDVKVKDTIPDGTEFIQGSIRVNGSETYNVKGQEEHADQKTQDELANGITVNVPAAEDNNKDGQIDDQEAEKTTVSFKVRVKANVANAGNKYTKTISNTAYVDDEEEGTKSNDIIVKKPHVTIEKTSTTANEKVEKGKEITYLITLTNDGTAPQTVIVKDSIPQGTEYKDQSLTVSGVEGEFTIDNLKDNGITVTVPAATVSEPEQITPAKVTIQFTVQVTGKKQADLEEVELENGEKIQNIAIMDKNPTDPGKPENQEKTPAVEHTYVKPIISSKKTAKIMKEDNPGYAKPGDKIQYTITITNSGDYKGEVTVKDQIPDGLEYEPEGQVQVKIGEATQQHTISELIGEQGIKITVPARTVGDPESKNGEAIITFEVTAKEVEGEAHTKKVKNTATIDDESVTSNEIVINESALGVTKTAVVEDEELEEKDRQENKVKVGSIIAYTITVNNEGAAPETVKVKDKIPEGTEFVSGSIKVNGREEESKVESDLTTEGIEVTVQAQQDATPGTATVEFKVRVTGNKQAEEKLKDGEKITNTATIEDSKGKETSSQEVENTYIEPVISKAKKATIKDEHLGYAKEGEKITYTITVTNNGGLKKEVTIKDSIPTGTSYLPESIKIDGVQRTEYSDEDLTGEGIKVTVPAKSDREAGKVTLSFDVIVDDLGDGEFEEQITNTARVDEEDVTSDPVEVKKANVKFSKVAEPGTDKKVTAGETITYTIKVVNSGTAEEEVIIKDEIPVGTTFVAESIKINGEEDTTKDDTNLREGITITVPAATQELEAQKDGEATIEFKVTVNDLQNGAKIRNVATMDEDPEDLENEEKQTKPVEHKYAEPIITAEKTAETSNKKGYVVAGDTIKYTITLTNEGGLEKEVIVKDTIPEGTDFVDGSIEVNPEHDEKPESGYTSQNLADGIKVIVPAATEETVLAGKQNGIATVSFTVKVKEQLEEGIKQIKNVAEVNRNPQEPGKPDIPEDILKPEVKTPVVKIEKSAEVTKKNAVEVQDELQNKVTVGDIITYTITINNLSDELSVENLEVKDIIPNGTELAEKVDTEEDGNIVAHYDQDSRTITWTIKEIQQGETINVSFKVRVKYSQSEDVKILNKATVDEKETNETEHEYVKPEPQVESSIVKESKTEEIISKNGSVYYEINFSATVDDFVGKAKITMVDTLPYPLDKEKMKEMAEEQEIDTSNGEEWLIELLDGGTYEETEGKYTITWEEEVDGINTFEDGEIQTISKTKTLVVRYIYPTLDETTQNLTNTANAKIELIEPDQDEPVTSDEPEKSEVTIPVNVKSTVTVHHYIYDPELPEGERYTKTKIVEDDEPQTGKVGDPYTTAPSEEVPANYTCKTPEPEYHEGKFTEEDIEVNYYYELTTPQVSNEMEKTATVEQTDPDGSIGDSPQLRREDGVVTYTIKYKTSIKDYIGKAVIEIVDTLPYAIDTTKSEVDLAGGEYDAENNTITWLETIEGIDTYANQSGETGTTGGTYENGTYTIEIVKEIKVVYVDQDVTKDIVNEVTGTTKVYYPEKHSTNPGEEQVTEEATDEEILGQEYKANLKVEKVWDDAEHEAHRPTGVNVNIKVENGNNLVFEDSEGLNETLSQILSEEGLTVKLEEDNSWSYAIEGLPKYDDTGRKLDYIVTESEVQEGDLEYYDNPEIVTLEPEVTDEVTNYTIRVTNPYKLEQADFDATITKEGTEEITTAEQAVDYTITFTSNISEYIGKATIEIVDTLPYAIDESKSELKGGDYDESARTITWTKDIDHINTYNEEDGIYEINETIEGIKLAYIDVDLKEATIENKVKGKLILHETEQTDEDETTYETDINVMGTVIVKHVEKGNEQHEIAEQEVITQKVGTTYTTEPRDDIEGYVYADEYTGNPEGEITKEEQVVTYYYEKADAKVKVKYLDEDGNSLLPDGKEELEITGKVGDPYETEEKVFEGYRLKEVKGEEEGTFTEEEQTVVYTYERIPAKVVVRYLEKDTDKVLLPEDTLEGYVGNSYQTTRKTIKNYKSAEPEPENSSGRMKVVMNPDNPNEVIEDTIIVTYYYERIPSGKVVVKYLDVDTGEDLTYIEEHKDGTMEEKTYGYDIEGNAGDKYTTEEFEIPYYNLFKKPENAAGELTEDGDTIIYYYQKKPFNFSVEKVFKSVILNGEVKNLVNNKSTKVEIVAATIPYAKLQVTYKIIVRNTGEINGKAKVIEMLPQGYRLVNPANYWAQTQDGNLEAKVELKAGETKELEVSLEWINGEDNFGIFDNTVKIVDLENEANFKEKSEDDNVATAELITSIKTGVEANITLIVTGTGLIIGLCVLVFLYERYNKERGIAMARVTIENKRIVIKKDKTDK